MLGGGVLATLCAYLDTSFQSSFLFMAAFVLVVTVSCVLTLHETPPQTPSSDSDTPGAPAKSALASLIEVVSTLRDHDVALMALYIGTYKAGEVMGDTMFKPYLVDQGHAVADIAMWSGVYGMLASIAGSAAAGQVGAGGLRSVALANLFAQWMRTAVVLSSGSPTAIVAVMCCEAFAGGALTTCVFTWMMTQVNSGARLIYWCCVCVCVCVGGWVGGE